MAKGDIGVPVAETQMSQQVVTVHPKKSRFTSHTVTSKIYAFQLLLLFLLREKLKYNHSGFFFRKEALQSQHVVASFECHTVCTLSLE